MNVTVTDTQAFGELEATAFEMLQQGPVEALITLRNLGTNTINYRFQQRAAGVWADLDDLGSEVNNTLVADQVRAIKVSSAYPQVRLVGNASGGSTVEFSVLRYVNRASGGALPLLAY